MANFVLQLLRNSALKATRAEAISALNAQLDIRKDGEMLLSRYLVDGKVYAILGIVNKHENGNVLTILEDNINAVPEKVAQAISAAETALSERITELETAVGEGGSVESQIVAKIQDLDVAAIGGAGKMITTVSEADGKISAQAIDATAANIAIVDADAKFEATNVEVALAEIDTNYKAAVSGEATARKEADDTLKSGYEAADKAINDKIGEVADGETIVGMIEATEEAAAKAAAKATTVVAKDAAAANLTLSSSVDETTGATTYTIGQSDIASAEGLAKEIEDRTKAVSDEAAAREAADNTVRGEFAAEDAKIRQELAEEAAEIRGEFAAADTQIRTDFAAADNTVRGEFAAADATLKADLLGDAAEDYNTLGKLEDKIQAVEGAAKSYSIAKLSAEEIAALDDSTNVKEAYKLIDEDSAKAGDVIKIYKDSSLKSVALEGQILNFTYILADGEESTVGVDVSNFLAESEFGAGLQVINHIVSIKLAEGSESFLTVDENGLKLSGVQNAINSAVSTAVEGLDATVGSKEIAEGKHVAVEVVEENGKLTVLTVSENDIASAKDLADEITARGVAEKAIEDAYKAADSAIETAYKAADEQLAKDYKAADDVVRGEFAVADTQIRTDFAAADTQIRTDFAAADATLKAAYESADSALDSRLTQAEKDIDALEGLVGSTKVADQITNAINALDVEDTVNATQYVSGVSETDGKISVSRATLVSTEANNALENKNGGVYMSTTIDCGTY